MNQQHPPVSSSPRLESLGQHLRWHRQRLGLSQEALAEALGVSARSIRRWEQDQAIPQKVARERLGHLFGTDPEAWYVNDGPPALSLIWHVPFHRNPFFTGREELLHSLHEKLSRECSMALTQSWAISGLGGIGKTQIALEYAYRYRQDYGVVFWVNAATRESLFAGLGTIAELLQLPEKDEHDHHRIALAVKRWLATHQDWLLVLDNADDIIVVQDVLPTERSGHLLLTTRAQALGPLAQRIEVETMGMAEGTLFLFRRARLLAPLEFLDQASQEQLAAAEAIVIEMDFLPLALDQAGAYLEEVGCSLSTYLELYRTHRAELLRRRGHVPGEHPEPVATTWSLNFQHIERANPAAAELLRLCAFLEPDAIPEELLSEGSAVLGPVLQPLTADTLRLNEALEELRKFSLVQRDPEARQLRLHRLVQAVLQDALEGEERRRWAERAVRAINLVFPDNTDLATWPYDRRLLPQAQAGSMLIQDCAFVFAEAATLLFRTANALKEYGLYEQAELLYQQTIHIQGQALGPEHPGVAHSLNKLADLYRTQGKCEQAELLYEQAVHIWEQVHGLEHPDVAHALNGLALLSREQGKYEQAEQFGQRALRVQEQAFGPEHPNIAPSLNNLAIAYQYQGKYEQAEPFFLRALHIWEQALGSEHPNVAYPLNNLGNLYQDQGKYEQAESFFLRALHIWEQALGPEQPKVAFPLYNLAELYNRQEKYEQAEPLYQRALHIWERAFGPEHPNVAHSLHGLANLSSNLGMDQQAELFYQRALSIWERTLGEQHPDTAETLHDFAVFQESRGRHQEAVLLYQRALVIREQILGVLHSATIATRTKYTRLSETQVSSVNLEPN